MDKNDIWARIERLTTLAGIVLTIIGGAITAGKVMDRVETHTNQIQQIQDGMNRQWGIIGNLSNDVHELVYKSHEQEPQPMPLKR